MSAILSGYGERSHSSSSGYPWSNRSGHRQRKTFRIRVRSDLASPGEKPRSLSLFKNIICAHPPEPDGATGVIVFSHNMSYGGCPLVQVKDSQPCAFKLIVFSTSRSALLWWSIAVPNCTTLPVLAATTLAGEPSPNEGCKTWAPCRPLSNKAVRHSLGRIADGLLCHSPKLWRRSWARQRVV